MEDFLQLTFLENPIRNWLWAGGICLVGFLLSRVVAVLLSKQLFWLIHYDTIPIANFVTLLRKPVAWIFMLGVFYWAAIQIHRPAAWKEAPYSTLLIFISDFYELAYIGTIAWACSRMAKFIGLVFQKKAELTDSKLDDQLVPFIRDLGIVGIWIFTVFVMLSRVFKVDVTALITSLGIGGVAIALAAKETLENFFASFTIFLDKPFIVGDAVMVSGITGDVEKIGFRSTRIRAVDGSLVTIPNRLMASQNLENQTQREFRRSKQYLKLGYQTPPEALRKIVANIQKLITTHPLTKEKEGLVRFDGFAESWLEVLVVFHVKTASWEVFNEVKEAINFEILGIIEAEGCSLAYPTIKVGINKG